MLGVGAHGADPGSEKSRWVVGCVGRWLGLGPWEADVRAWWGMAVVAAASRVPEVPDFAGHVEVCAGCVGRLATVAMWIVSGPSSGCALAALGRERWGRVVPVGCRSGRSLVHRMVFVGVEHGVVNGSCGFAQRMGDRRVVAAGKLMKESFKLRGERQAAAAACEEPFSLALVELRMWCVRPGPRRLSGCGGGWGC